ncbi:hypothetical protein ACFQU2_09340 [Siccirubricoccus deserti]
MPDALRDHAALVFADTLGAILAGHREASVAALVVRHATGGVPLIGTAAAAPPPMAAFITGLAGTAVELDEGITLPAVIRRSMPLPRLWPRPPPPTRAARRCSRR